MIDGFIAVGFMMAAVLLSAGGFMANNPQLSEQMVEPPGFYWTWGTACLIPAGLLTGAPAMAIGFNFIILSFVATSWALATRRQLKEATR